MNILDWFRRALPKEVLKLGFGWFPKPVILSLCGPVCNQRRAKFKKKKKAGAYRSWFYPFARAFDVVQGHASLVAQTVKHLPALQETRLQFLGREDPLEKEMAIHSSTLAWKIPWMEEPDRLQSMGLQRVGHNWATSLSFPFPFLSGPCRCIRS